MPPESPSLPGGPGRLEFFPQGDSRILGWLREALQEGESINQQDPNYAKANEAMDYVAGAFKTEVEPSYLPKQVNINECRRAIKAHISALTDLQPLFSHKSFHERFADRAHYLNRMTTIWWVNTFADLQVAAAGQYALAAGAGDIVIEYDENLGAGETRLIPRDWRDTLPIRPTRDHSIQNWEGVTLRELVSVNKLRARYPEFAASIKPDEGGLGKVFSRFKSVKHHVTRPVSTLDGLHKGKGMRAEGKAGTDVAVYRTYLRDRSINTASETILVGTPGTNWCYTVAPGQRLYPGSRLIVWIESCPQPFYDGPNPYWHEMYPVARMRLDPWPWLFTGLSLISDLVPAQDTINMIVKYFLQVFQQSAARGSVWDKNTPESVFRRFDARRPNWKVKRGSNFSEGFQLSDVPQLPPWSLEFLQLMFTKFDQLAGTANLQALLQLRQSPGADTIQAYLDALTGDIRWEARNMEAFLRDLAPQVKSNFFQFYSAPRRMAMLGQASGQLDELDYDPDVLVPMTPLGDPGGYIPELSPDRSLQERARFFMNQFSFFVSPHSMLSMEAMTTKMLHLQLARLGYMDFWTLMESMGVPNVGTPPPVMLPVTDVPPGTQPAVDPMTGQPLPIMELRQPLTITERLIAMGQLGIGQTESPAGRKASGQEAPSLKSRSDGSTTVTES